MKISRQLLGYVPVNIANIAVSFGLIAVLTRILDGAEFGRYALAVTIMHFFHNTLLTWTEASVARFYARAERNGDMASFLKTIYTSALTISAIALPCALVILYFVPLGEELKFVVAIALCSTILSLFFNLGLEAHKAGERIGRYSGVYTSERLLSFVAAVLLVQFTPLREAGAVAAIILSCSFALIIDLPFMLRRMRGGRTEFARTKGHLSYGVPICLSLFLTYSLAQGDVFFIKYFMGDLAVGQYNAGYNLANRAVDVIFIWVAMAVTPVAITVIENEGTEKARAVMRNYGGILLLFALPAATGIALVAEPAGLILGESVRAEAVKIIPWIAFAGVLNGFISYYTQRAFMLSNNTFVLVLTLIPPVILNVVLNLLLIPAYGLAGAIGATLAAYGFGIVISFGVARRYFPLPIPFRALAECAFACAVMAICVQALPVSHWPDFPHLLAKAVVGAAIYGAIAYFINAANCRTLIAELQIKLKRSDYTQAQIEGAST